MVSPAAKSVTPNVPFKEYDRGDVVDNILPFALVVPPTIFSPLLNVPVIFDNQNNSIAEHFGLPAFPYWVFLNDDGTINMRHSGSLSEEAFGQIMTAGLVEANN